MYIFELNYLLFFIKSMKNPSLHLNITKWILALMLLDLQLTWN